MKLRSLYPVIMTDKVREVAEFYTSVFDFCVTFDSEWYISLVRKENDRFFEIAVLNFEHESVPLTHRNKSAGILINFEVENATQMYEWMVDDHRITLVKALKDENFGQRHFMIEDPTGILIDVIENIPPSEEYLRLYQEGVFR